MNNKFHPAIHRLLLPAGSLLLVTVLCISFLGFAQQFIDYALNLFYMTSRAGTAYLQITPLH